MIAEDILQDSANRNMIKWNQEEFKNTHPSLYITIIQAIDEALTMEFKKCKICKGKGENQVNDIDFDTCMKCKGTGKESEEVFHKGICNCRNAETYYCRIQRIDVCKNCGYEYIR